MLLWGICRSFRKICGLIFAGDNYVTLGKSFEDKNLKRKAQNYIPQNQPHPHKRVNVITYSLLFYKQIIFMATTRRKITQLAKCVHS